MIVYLLLTVLSALLSHAYAGPLSIRDDAYLSAHNNVRAAHGASPLNWDNKFAQKAAQWANACQLRLTNGVLNDSPYGELQVAASGTFSIQDAINTFVEDKSSYNPDHPVPNHFTQVVWKATTHVGCAVSTCKGLLEQTNGTTKNHLDGTYYVCLYNPPGNVVGEEKKNVVV